MVRWHESERELRTSVTARLGVRRDQDGHLIVSWNCDGMSDGSQLDLAQLLPNVMADAKANSAERVKVDLKNNILQRWRLVWYLMDDVRAGEGLWSYRGG